MPRGSLTCDIEWNKTKLRIRGGIKTKSKNDFNLTIQKAYNGFASSLSNNEQSMLREAVAKT